MAKKHIFSTNFKVIIMKIKLLSLFIVVSVLMGCNLKNKKSSNKAENVSGKPHNVVAYVAGYRSYDFNNIDVSGITHINYAFGNIKGGEAVFDTTKIDGKNLTPVDLKKLNSLKTKNPKLKILISIGGWSWSGNFSDAALTSESRYIFAKSCAKMVKEYNLDGIDLDWEYPNQTGAGNVYRPEDVHNFTLLLKAVREELDKIAKEKGTKQHYLLTIATGADKTYVENTELGELSDCLDFINIMTYDFYNGLHKINGHHSNLYPSANPELDMNSIVNAVDLHINAGFPAKKLNLGIPFYGRIWKGVEKKNDQVLFNNAETVGMGIDYKDFCQNINNNGFIRYWDDDAKAPYLWNQEEKVFISYEDCESIALKIDYLKKRGLAGVMFWEYCADKDKKLLKAVVSNIEE